MPLQCTIPLQTNAGATIPAGCFIAPEFTQNRLEARLVNHFYLSKVGYDGGDAEIKNQVLFDDSSDLVQVTKAFQEQLSPAQYAAMTYTAIETFVKNRLELITGPGTWQIVPY